MSVKNLVALLAICVFTIAFTVLNFQKKPWPVPEAAKNKKNPVASNAESIANGKSLWSTHCKSCHGSKGLGDGSKAAQLNTEPGDFSKNDFQAQTDGSIFYKTSEGRDDMPSYKSKIPDQNDLWSLVNFIRTFKKGGTVVPVAKDTSKNVIKPVKTDIPPVKKDTVVKKVTTVPAKNESIPLQEQLNNLRDRVDSLEKIILLLKEKIVTINQDSSIKK